MQKKGILEWQNPEMKEAVDAIENGFFFCQKLCAQIKQY